MGGWDALQAVKVLKGRHERMGVDDGQEESSRWAEMSSVWGSALGHTFVAQG